MNGIERRNIECLVAHEGIREEDRYYLDLILRECGWSHALTDAVISEISHIRALACGRIE